MNIKPVVLLTGALLPFVANAAPPHVHGAAELHVALDGKALTIELHGPGMNFMGFEHEARTPAEKTALQDMHKKLEQASIVTLPAAAHCVADKPVVQVIPDPDGDGHSDVVADYEFKCSDPDALNGFDIDVFRDFPGTHTLKVDIVTAKSQHEITLAPPARHVGF